MNYNADKIHHTERRKMAFLFSLLLVFLMCSLAYSQAVLHFQSVVVIYENPNFEGRSRTLAIGSYRFFTNINEDFNDIASSIKVSTGLAAIIYDHADEGGGYGISVDLLEDCPDLSKYNFNDKVSYITVFSTTQAPMGSGFIWVRNSIQNGQFVPGHWERPRVGGNPVNTVAVVSPPYPPHTPTGPTTIQVNGAQFTITSLGVQSRGDAATWDFAETKELMGVIGSDFRGVEEIGSAAFERASNNIAIPDNINFWYPQKQPNDHRSIVYYKRTLSGTVPGYVEGESAEVHFAEIEGTYEDHDLNLDITPSPNYMYLITEGHQPALSTAQAVQLRAENLRFRNPTGEANNPCTEPFKVVEAEIDVRKSAKNKLLSLVGPRVGKQICVYGPWIYDKGHCYHPEIHPAEQIWWSEDVGNNNKKYNLNVFCDASKRFWWRHQMDDGTKLKPWGAPPIKGTFAIAFEVELENPGEVTIGKKPGKKFEVSNIDDYNVAVIPNTDKIYNLVYQNRTLVSFVPHNDAFKVSYEKIGLKAGTINIVRGFLVIETTVGTVTQIATRIAVKNSSTNLPDIMVKIPRGTDPNEIEAQYEEQVFKKVEGHYMFSILRTEIKSPGVLDVAR